MQKIASLTLAIAIADIMTGFTWQIKYLATSCFITVSQTLSLGPVYSLATQG